MDLDDLLGEAGRSVLAVAAAVGGIIFIASVAGIYVDARRRVAKGEALVWAIGNLMAQPLGLPLYLWRAYGHPDRIPRPASMLPWARAANYVSASTWALTLAAIPLVGAMAVLGRLSPEWASSLVVIVGVQGLTVAPLMIAWTYAFRVVVDRRPALSLGTPLQAGAVAAENLVGLCCGFALVGAAVVALWGLGIAEVRSADVGPGLIALGGLLVPLYLSAFFEEIVLRGYLQRSLYLAWGHTGAVAGSAVCFGLLHAMNPGVGWMAIGNIVLVGILLSLLVIRTNSIWVPTGIHFGWNLMMGPILGLPVSGLQVDSLVRVELIGADSWLGGGEFGPEASPLVSAVLLVGIAVAGALVARGRRWQEPPDEEAERPLQPGGAVPSAAGDAAPVTLDDSHGPLP